MNKYIDENRLANVESLTKAWREDFAEYYSDKPRLYSMLTTVPLTFEFEQERLIVIFPVANEAQKQWLELKMIPEMITYYKSITGIQDLFILPFISEVEEKVSRKYYQSPTRPSLPEETICLQNLVKDLNLEIKWQYNEMAEQDIF